jgi:hypothetical protein
VPKNLDPQPPKSLGIDNEPRSTKKLGNHPKSLNQRPNPEFEGSRSSTKMHKTSIMIPTNTTRKMPTSDTKKGRFSSQTAINDVGCYENATSLIERHKPRLMMRPYFAAS